MVSGSLVWRGMDEIIHKNKSQEKTMNYKLTFGKKSNGV